MQIPAAGKCCGGDGTILPAGPYTLITGCHAHETAGDTPEGGVMTSTLCRVVRAMKEQDPEAPLSAR
jgi:hypothetical protein